MLKYLNTSDFFSFYCLANLTIFSLMSKMSSTFPLASIPLLHSFFILLLRSESIQYLSAETIRCRRNYFAVNIVKNILIRTIHSESFCPRTTTFQNKKKDCHIDAYSNTTIIRSSSLGTIVIYPPYPRNLDFRILCL